MGTAEAKSVPDLQMWRLEPLISFLRLAMPLYGCQRCKTLLYLKFVSLNSSLNTDKSGPKQSSFSQAGRPFCVDIAPRSGLK